MRAEGHPSIDRLLFGLVALSVGLGATLTTIFDSYAVFAGLILVVVLTLGVWRCIGRQHEFVPGVPSRAVKAAWLLKVTSAGGYYALEYLLYGGLNDAAAYDERAQALLSSVLRLEYEASLVRSLPGTGVVDIVAGLAYALVTPSALAGFFVFSLVAFIGQVYFVKTLSVIFKPPDIRFPAYLMLFTPSIIYWPSPVGKDALLLGCLGVATYFFVRLTANPHARGPALGYVLGVLGVSALRPQIALAILAASILIFVIRAMWTSFRSQMTRGTRKALLRMSLLFAGAVSVAVVQFQASTALGGVDLESVQSFIEYRETVAFPGGSSFPGQPVSSPQELPMGLFTVLFRPLPHEAHNLAALIASIEGVGIGILMFAVVSRSRPQQKYLYPVVLGGALVVVCLSIPLSFIDNFGALVRQRAQVLPFLWLSVGALAAGRSGRGPPPGSRWEVEGLISACERPSLGNGARMSTGASIGARESTER